jgi:signal transduction histidine kinase/Flp pilus assembly protein TadD
MIVIFATKPPALPMRNILYFFVMLLITANGFSQNFNTIDSLEQALKGAEGENKSEILFRLSELYYFISVDKSLEYDLMNAELQKELGNKEGLSNIYNNLGLAYYKLGDYSQSLEYFELSLLLREELQDTINIVKNLNNLGVIAQTAGNFEKALEYLTRSLVIKFKLDDTLSTARTLNNIGVIYKDVGKYDDSRKFLLQALQYYQAVNDVSGISAAFNNLGQIMDAIDKNDSARYYYIESLKLKEQINDTKGIGNTLNNLGLIYFKEGDYVKAEENLRRAEQIREEIGDQFGLASSQNNLGNLFFSMKKYQPAEEYFLKSIAISEKRNLMGMMQRNYAGLSRLYEETGKLRQALDYHKAYSDVRDSVFSSDLNAQLASLKVKYETEKNRRELEMLRQQSTIQELQLINSQKQKQQLSAWIVIILLTGILVIMLLQFRNKRRLNAQLQRINQQLEIRVKERTRELEQANTAKDRFFSIIAHDLKSPFNGLLGLTNILHEDFDILSENEKREFSGIIKESTSDIYKLLENLLEWSASQTGRLHLVKKQIDLTEMTEKILKTNQPAINKKQLEMMFRAENKKMPHADQETISTVLRNLISNAIKFTPKGGKISIRISDYFAGNQPEILVEVNDNGIGIKPEHMKDLFVLNKKYRSQGTDQESGTGLGLLLCKEFVEKNGGVLNVDSKPGAGSTFSFTLPTS